MVHPICRVWQDLTHCISVVQEFTHNPCLVVLSLFLVATSQQFLESVYVTEAKLIASQYEVSVSAINSLGLICTLIPFLMFVPAGFIADRFGSKTSLVIGCTFALTGVWLRTIATRYHAYNVELIATSLIAVADGFIITLFVPVSQGWFPEKYATLVLCILHFSISLGPFLVTWFSYLPINEYAGLQLFLTTVSSTFAFVFFQSPPPRKHNIPSFCKVYRDFFSNTDFMTILLPTATLGGLASTCLVLVQRIAPPNVGSNRMLFLLINASCVGGVFSSLWFGRSRNRKHFVQTLCEFAIATSSFFFLSAAFQFDKSTYLSIFLFGIFGPPLQIIAIQIAIILGSRDVDYPTDASIEGFCFLITNLVATVCITFFNGTFFTVSNSVLNIALLPLFIFCYLWIHFKVTIPEKRQRDPEAAPLLAINEKARRRFSGEYSPSGPPASIAMQA